MLDKDPAKCEAWSAESSAVIYTTGTLILHNVKHTSKKNKKQNKKKNKNKTKTKQNKTNKNDQVRS